MVCGETTVILRNGLNGALDMGFYSPVFIFIVWIPRFSWAYDLPLLLLILPPACRSRSSDATMYVPTDGNLHTFLLRALALTTKLSIFLIGALLFQLVLAEHKSV